MALEQRQVEAFKCFEERLYTANAVMNLTRVPPEDCWLRHFVDSLLFQDLFPHQAKALDIGAGPGFPAWPLACARPDLSVTALDSSGKMIGFLNANPLPNLTTVQVRAEEWDVREQFDVVTGRALAPLPVQLELSAAPARIGGIVISLRSIHEAAEIEKFAVRLLGLAPPILYERPLPGTDVVRLAAAYEKLGATAAKYPRTWSEMKRKPLA